MRLKMPDAGRKVMRFERQQGASSGRLQVLAKALLPLQPAVHWWNLGKAKHPVDSVSFGVSVQHVCRFCIRPYGNISM